MQVSWKYKLPQKVNVIFLPEDYSISKIIEKDGSPYIVCNVETKNKVNKRVFEVLPENAKSPEDRMKRKLIGNIKIKNKSIKIFEITGD